ncbi:MAG TPA: PAS domain-containing protein [Stellaceae bacterium]
MNTTTTEFRFEDSDTERLDLMSALEFDTLPFGIIRLDIEGRVLAYNRAESLYSGLKQQHVIGRDWFRDIAPCTNTAKFFGKFKEGVAKDMIDTTFDYVFTRFSEPTVRVHLLKAPGEDLWVLIKRV